MCDDSTVKSAMPCSILRIVFAFVYLYLFICFFLLYYVMLPVTNE